MGMRRRLLRLVAVLLGLVLVAAACSSNDDKGSTSSSSTARSSVKVGLVYDVGGRGDQSFNDAAFRGLTQAKDDLGVSVQDLEPSKGGQYREELLRTLADQGYPFIIGVGFNFSGPMTNVAKDYPKVRFAIIDDDSATGPNITNLLFSEEQGSYLIGAVAAMTSTTGKIGFVGGVHAPLIKKFEAGYVAGAKKINPNISVDVKYIQETDNSGFNDPASAKEIANAMYQGGEDVVYHAAGGSGAGVFEAAKDWSASHTKVWAVGVDSDQYKTADPSVRSFILTSMLKRVDVAVFDAIKDFQAGDLKAGPIRYSLANDGIAISTSGGFLTKDVQSKVADLKQQIISGAIQVPTTP
jgi:basic membrane protein A